MNILYWLAPLCDWDAINARRCDLIDLDIDGPGTLNPDQQRELAGLQQFLEIYLSWATDHQLMVDIFEAELWQRLLRTYCSHTQTTATASQCGPASPTA